MYLHGLVRVERDIATCRGELQMDYGLDDWIYCTLYIHISGLNAITVLLLVYTPYSSPLHTH
jgi:hypothetical protein